MRSAETLFGADASGRPRLSLERASTKIPVGQVNDTVLTKCYRNQLEVLVTAHAMGFGIYSSQIVQMLEDEAHWNAVGYELIAGKYEIGRNVVLKRPAKNSPVSISGELFPLISSFAADDFTNEINWVIEEIRTLINEGVHPCAHLHIGWQREGRVPVRRVWTPELFAGFVFRNMFADSWFRSQDGNTPDMDGYESEIFFKREKRSIKRVHETMFHAFEAEVVFLD